MRMALPKRGAARDLLVGLCHPMRMAILSESAMADESKGPTRRGSVSRLLALSVPNVSRAKPRTEWCRAKSRGSALHLELSGKARLPRPRGHLLLPLPAQTFPSSQGDTM